MPGAPASGTYQLVTTDGTKIEVAFARHMADSPSTGDVLITTEGGRHLLSIVPYPHRLTLSDFDLALKIARKWAEANQVHVWRSVDETVTKLPLD